MLLRLWRIDAIRATVVVSVLSLVLIPIQWAFVGFERMIALGVWENLLQAVIQGILAGPAAIYLFTRSVVLLGAGRAAVFPSLVPGFTLLVGYLGLGIVPSIPQLLGFAIVLIGFRLTQKAISPACHSRACAVQIVYVESRRESSRSRIWICSDLEAALAALNSGLRMTLRTQFTSIWLPIQLGIIVAVAAAAMGIAAIVRKRFDLVSATMSWPPYLRLAVRAVMSHLGTIIFILLLSIVRVSMRASMDRPRTYLLLVAIDLASAWVVINIVAGVIRNQFVNRVVAVSAWTIAALSILRLLDPIVAGLDSITLNLGGLRITPLVILKTVGADDAAGLGRDRGQQLPRQAAARLLRSHAVDPGAAQQADPHRAARRSRSSSC